MRKLLLATVAILGASMGAAAVADAQTTVAPAPGTVTVRLNGRFRFYAYSVHEDNAQNGAGGNKLSSYGFGEYARLYPGFDGVAANGLKYGASLEIRQDNGSPAGGGTQGSISGNSATRGSLYLRRSWGYLGTDQLGTIRLGSADQPSSLYMTGNFENFNDGGLNGDVPAFIASNLQLTWPFADVGSYYTTNKAIYLSPQLYGFDVGASYEPNTSNVSGDSASCSVAAPGCNDLSATPVNGESARRRNTVDALVRYRGTFGGFGVAATAGGMYGGHVADNSGLPFTSNPLAVGGARQNYEGIQVFDSGIALTYAGFSVGGKYQVGRFNGSGLQPVPKGLSHGEAFLIGASYTIGPVVVGAHYVDYTSAGDLGNAYFGRQRREQGVAAGGTYTIAPGLAMFLSYDYQQRKQNGYNFITGAGVNAANVRGQAGNNKVDSSIIALGTSFTW